MIQGSSRPPVARHLSGGGMHVCASMHSLHFWFALAGVERVRLRRAEIVGYAPTLTPKLRS